MTTSMVSLQRRSFHLLAVLAAAVSLSSGCDRQIETSYAAVRGDSINGVSAFVQLLRDTGHATIARQELPRQIGAQERTIVVFDDSFTGLRPEAAAVLDHAMTEDGNRTFVLVLRDGDAVIDYLLNIIAHDTLFEERKRAAQYLLEEATAKLDQATSHPRESTPPFPDALQPHVREADGAVTTVRLRCDAADDDMEADELELNHLERVEKPDLSSPTSRVGRPQQTPDERGSRAAGVPARWELHRRLEPPADGLILWETDTDGEPLLVRTRQGSKEIFVLASSTPILNGGLVDPGNRRLAEQLARLLPTEGSLLLAGSSRVASGGGADGGGSRAESSPWRLLFVQPLPWLAAQAIAVLGLFCWCTTPIFGRPRRSSPRHVHDFGKHVGALASLLARTPNGVGYCWKRLEEWRKQAPRAGRKPARWRP